MRGYEGRMIRVKAKWRRVSNLSNSTRHVLCHNHTQSQSKLVICQNNLIATKPIFRRTSSHVKMRTQFIGQVTNTIFPKFTSLYTSYLICDGEG
jgi:hypothetical protein